MFLSNRQPLILATVLLILTVLGCSWFGSSPGGTSVTPKIEDKVNLYPFETKEPEVFSGDLVVTDGTTESKTSFARKNEKWRFDMYIGDEAAISRVQGEKLVQLDHSSETFAEIPQGAIGEPPSFVADMNAGLLSSGEHAEFEKTSTDGTIETYTATLAGRQPIFLKYDTSLKMIVKQQFAADGSGVVFEVRNAKLEVDDAVFTVPQGYKKVTWNEMLEKLK